MAATGAGDTRNTAAKAVLLSAVGALGGFLVGFDTAVINGAVNAVQGEFELSPFLIGVTVSRPTRRTARLRSSAPPRWPSPPPPSGSPTPRSARVRVRIAG